MAVPAGTAELAVALQTARGATASAATARTYLTGGNVGPARLYDVSRETVTGLIPGSSYVAAVGSEGDPEIAVRPSIIGLLLYAALGAKAVSGASDPWTHTFTLGTALPWLTLWRHIGGVLNECYPDCKVAALVISAQPGVLRARASFIGLSVRSRTSQMTAVAVETVPPFEYRHGAGALKFEGAAASNIGSWELAIDTGVYRRPSILGLDLGQGLFSIRLTVDQVIADMALWNRLHFGSASPSNDTLATTTPLELAGSPAGFEFLLTLSATRTLKIALPRVSVAALPGVRPDPGGHPIAVSGAYDALKPVSGSPITATLLNGVSAY